MSKIKVNLSLKNKNEVINKEFKGIIIDNKIIYKDENISVTFLCEKNKLIMNRNSPEYNAKFIFSNNNITKCVYNVKSEGILIYFYIKTKKLIIDNKRFVVDYELYQQDELIEVVNFEIKYEVI